MIGRLLLKLGGQEFSENLNSIEFVNSIFSGTGARAFGQDTPNADLVSQVDIQVRSLPNELNIYFHERLNDWKETVIKVFNLAFS